MTDKKHVAIETVGLTKIFRDFWGKARVAAVDGLSLEIYSREVFGLLGPNGSGKSTTIKMLLGLLFPSRGAAKVLGFPPGHVKTNRRIGYLPEESHFYPFLNARETLDFYGRLFGIGAEERKIRVESLLDMVGLTGAARRPVGEYSKGMMRRIGLAQALINDPDLLILDEPTSGLDPIGTRQIKDLICELGRRGKTVLLCSHLLGDVEDVCDRIAILYGGKIQSLGGVDELLAAGDQTQIRTDALSAEVIDKIKKIIQSERGGVSVAVETPRVRLEDYFLSIIEKAQLSHRTSGAQVGSGVSAFLRSQAEEAPEEILTQLVEGLEKPGPAATEPAEPREAAVEAKVDDGVLKRLVESKPVSASPEAGGELKKEEQTTARSGAVNDKVDRSVLDELLGKRAGDEPGEK